MKKQPYMPRQKLPFIDWHDNLTANTDLTVPGVVAGDVTNLKANNDAIHAKKKVADAADRAAVAANKDLNLTIGASKTQASKMVKNIKNADGFDPVQAKKLRIEGPEDTTDLTQAMPVLTVEAVNGGVVKVYFPKPHAEGVHIQSKVGNQADFTLLASATHSPFIDNRPLAVAGQPETRSYRAIYFQGKAEFGLMSTVVVATAIV
jgi:hypothetical protein